jgi:2,3-bisphosphoglycerate-independent phosphoglycerate mutase
MDQDVVKISKEISTGAFAKNAAFVAAIKNIKKNNSALHLMGLLSNGQSPHSDPDHLYALLSMARLHKVKRIYLHLFTDGRDSPPRSALKSVMALERFLKPNEIIATLSGRFYAMDRNKIWERTQWAYDAMLTGKGHKADSPQEGITRAYNADVTDEFIEPVVMYRHGKMVPRIGDGDSIIFFNFRSDRARQLAKVFVQHSFEKKNPGAKRRSKFLRDLIFVAMTDFGPDLDTILTAYPAEDTHDTLPMLLKDKRQIYIAESEKFAHVTFFFNGGYTGTVAGEKQVKIASPKVTHYTETPAMSTVKIASEVIKSLPKYDFICANFAAADMLGHSGDIKVGIKAAEVIDGQLKKIVQVVKKSHATLIIAADHGNLEYMSNLNTHEIVTEHTANPVPCIIYSKQYSKEKFSLRSKGVLADIAPTVLEIFDIKKSKLMTGKSLLKKK